MVSLITSTVEVDGAILVSPSILKFKSTILSRILTPEGGAPKEVDISFHSQVLIAVLILLKCESSTNILPLILLIPRSLTSSVQPSKKASCVSILEGVALDCILNLLLNKYLDPRVGSPPPIMYRSPLRVPSGEISPL